MQRRGMGAHILMLVFVMFQGIGRLSAERTLIVQFENDICASEVQDFATRYGVDLMTKVYANYYSFLDKRQDSDLLASLASDEKVKWVDYETEEMYTLLSTDMNTWETINDPMWQTQKWYLSEQPFNAKSGWEHCYTGRGVTIGLLDNGVLDHPDLSIDRALSKNFWMNVPVTPGSHGTQVAGVATAKSNDLCGIGVAPQASVADLRVFGQNSTIKTTHLMEALSYKQNDIHIYSNSWTISNSGISVGGPKKPLLDILEEGTKLGRNGKGSVYLWGTGNGGPTGDSCAYDGFSNSVFTLGITAVDRNKRMLKSGENCSATFAAAPSQNTGGMEIVTTFGTDKCTNSFSRCSAAVPMASGAIALVLEENPNLTWRDIKHLLARSGSKDGLLPNNFEENAAGYKVSPTFGFGELDIGRLIKMAHPHNWLSVGGWKEMKHCVVEPNFKSWPVGIPERLVQFEVPSECNIQFLEDVLVEFNLTFPKRGHIQMHLLSPSNTRRLVLPGRDYDIFSQDLSIPVKSVQFWGETVSNGNARHWNLNIEDSHKSGEKGYLLSMKLHLYGMDRKPIDPNTNDVPTRCPLTVAENTTKKPTTKDPFKTGETCWKRGSVTSMPPHSKVYASLRFDAKTCKEDCTYFEGCKAVTFYKMPLSPYGECTLYGSVGNFSRNKRGFYFERYLC